MGTTMNTHLNQDELVLHYYGEMSTAEEASTKAHLAACAECSASYRRLQRMLAVVDETTVVAPELPEHFERTVWARLEPGLRPERRGWLSWLELSPARLAWGGAVVVLMAGAFVAGRMTQPPRNIVATTATPAATTATTTTTAPAETFADRRERVLLSDLSEHLDRSQTVLVELVSGDDATMDVANERGRAERLVSANRMYRQTAQSTGDTTVVELLDELERVLVDVAAGPAEMSARDLDEVRRRIESKGLLFKLRILSSEVRDRQRTAVRQRTGQRSSL
jgi:hypothetical protein